MSPLSIKFGLVSLVAHASQVHGALTCIGSGYLTNANFALSTLNPTNQVIIYNANGQDVNGTRRYATNTDENETCYPPDTTEMFALSDCQRDGFRIEFTESVKKVTLDMRDFGDWNTDQMKDGKVTARAMNGVQKVNAIADDKVEFDHGLKGGDACNSTSGEPGQYRFELESTGKETFDAVEILFESKTEDGNDSRLIDQATSWGNLCYEAAEVDSTNANASEVTSTDENASKVDSTNGNASDVTSTDENASKVTSTDKPLSPEKCAVDNPKFEKCAAPKMSDVGNMPEVSVCGDATYQLPATVALADVCSGSGDTPTGTVCPTQGARTTLACRENILSYLTGDQLKAPGTCVAPEDATCQKLLTGVWGCVFPGNCNTRNTCLGEEACSDEYEKDADGKCVLGKNNYPVAKQNYSGDVNTTAAEELSVATTEYSYASAGAAAMTVSGIIGLATAGTFVFSMM